ncbi:MAG: PEP-CTERM sorting domain-containing protein [Planctomycetes bacterium]|nr:PEP-CTERM sorting domain-containing protein [Planctomycetota bacterium]
MTASHLVYALRGTLYVFVVAMALTASQQATATPIVAYNSGLTVLNQPNWFTAGFGNVGYGFFKNGGAAASPALLLSGGQVSGGYITVTQMGAGIITSQTNVVALQHPAGGTFNAWTHATTSGLTGGVYSDAVSILFGAATPANLSMHIRILVGAEEQNTASPPDISARIRLSTGTGGSGSTANIAPTIRATPLPARADWYNFDVTNINPGDTLYISAQPITGSSPNRFNPLNGVAFATDVVVPEPGTWALASVGLLGLLLFARRRT